MRRHTVLGHYRYLYRGGGRALGLINDSGLLKYPEEVFSTLLIPEFDRTGRVPGWITDVVWEFMEADASFWSFEEEIGKLTRAGVACHRARTRSQTRAAANRAMRTISGVYDAYMRMIECFIDEQYSGGRLHQLMTYFNAYHPQRRYTPLASGEFNLNPAPRPLRALKAAYAAVVQIDPDKAEGIMAMHNWIQAAPGYTPVDDCIDWVTW